MEYMNLKKLFKGRKIVFSANVLKREFHAAGSE
jgi:hypothetical protein